MRRLHGTVCPLRAERARSRRAHVRRWCEITGLKQDVSKNGLLVEIVEENKDGVVEIQFDGKENFQINAHNLAPVKGSEKMSMYHKEHVLNVNGINCASCKKSLLEALVDVEGVAACAVTIATKADSGVHPNPVALKGAIDIEQVKTAVAKLDAGRNKFTIVANRVGN